MDTIVGEAKMGLDEALVHYGVKGMKWGVIRDKTKAGVNKVVNGSPDKSGKTRKDVRETRRTVNRNLSKDLAGLKKLPGKVRDVEINAARDNLRTASKKYREAGKKYREDKQAIGKNAAKQALIRAEGRKLAVVNRANQDTRFEATLKVAMDIGEAVARAYAPPPTAARPAPRPTPPPLLRPRTPEPPRRPTAPRTSTFAVPRPQPRPTARPGSRENPWRL